MASAAGLLLIALAGCSSSPEEVEVVVHEPEIDVLSPPPVVIEAPEPEPELVLPVVDPELLASLPVPSLAGLLPEGLPQVGVDGPSALAALDVVPGTVAVPLDVLTAGFVAPGPDAVPVLALHRDTADFEALPARWLVVDAQPGWVQVMAPIGRGALPSVDPSLTNHHAVWVLADDVSLEFEPSRLTVSISERTLTIDRHAVAEWVDPFAGAAGSSITVVPSEPSPEASPTSADAVVEQSPSVVEPGGTSRLRGSETTPAEPVTIHVGVGQEDRRDTVQGLCVVVGLITIHTGEPGLLTNCQSESMDGFQADFALFAIHPGTGFDPATGGSVSWGCIRVTRAHFDQYLASIPAGTPIVILP